MSGAKETPPPSPQSELNRALCAWLRLRAEEFYRGKATLGELAAAVDLVEGGATVGSGVPAAVTMAAEVRGARAALMREAERLENHRPASKLRATVADELRVQAQKLVKP